MTSGCCPIEKGEDESRLSEGSNSVAIDGTEGELRVTTLGGADNVPEVRLDTDGVDRITGAEPTEKEDICE
jgi:hypothetical protein